jgi:PAS domain S-box-containing protein
MTIAWSMCSAACAMLGLISVMLWLRGQRMTRYVLAATMALAASASAMTELNLARAPDIATYERVMDVQVVLTFIILISLVWFVYAHFGTASRRLAEVITVLWLAHLAAQFLAPGGAVFSEITSLEQITTSWGESFAYVRGDTSPWKSIADVASLLILLFLGHASIGAWRTGQHQRAIVLGGGTALFIIIGGLHTPLVDAGLVRTPYMISFAFLAIVFALTYQLADEALLANRYAGELALKEARWQDLMAMLPVMVVRRDVTGRIEDANAAMAAATGYRKEELIGQHFSRFVTATEADRAMERFERALQNEADAPSIFQLKSQNGTARSVAWSTVSLVDGDANVTGTLSVGLDLTEQVRAEADLLTARREMDRLARATLLGEVSAGLAHELSQPLAAILSNAQAARRYLARPVPDMHELHAILEDIIADDKRAGDVIHGLRRMLRRETVASGPTDLAAAIRASSHLFTSELRSHRLSLVLELDEHARSVSGDSVQIQQVIMNLILNSIRAMENTEPGRREITISSRAAEGFVTVSVADRGSGLPAETLAKMFDPFVTSRRGGLGMGLAVCKRIVEASGGSIWAENRDGGGATVNFTLPLATDQPRADS